jgi:hypothetical protein
MVQLEWIFTFRPMNIHQYLGDLAHRLLQSFLPKRFKLIIRHPLHELLCSDLTKHLVNVDMLEKTCEAIRKPPRTAPLQSFFASTSSFPFWRSFSPFISPTIF